MLNFLLGKFSDLFITGKVRVNTDFSNIFKTAYPNYNTPLQQTLIPCFYKHFSKGVKFIKAVLFFSCLFFQLACLHSFLHEGSSGCC